MKKSVSLLLVAIVILVAAMVWRAEQFAVDQPADSRGVSRLDWNEMAAIERFAGALRHATVSHKDRSKVDFQAFEDFQAFLAQQFPRVFSEIPHERVDGYSLLFRWQGADESADPIMLLAHQDVVPVIPGTEREWTHPPFSGRVVDGYVWGRGAVDDKASVVGILEAVERLLAEDFNPPRTIYLAFGHDEEVGGQGAKAIAQLLAGRGERLAFLLDEGGIIASGMVPGISSAVALIGPGEKGYASLRLTARGTGGHSSMPPQSTAAGKIARAVTRLESRPFPSDLGFTREFIRHLGSDQPFMQRLVFANLWLFSPLAEKVLAADPLTNAGIRTTTAVTMLSGSVQDNVLPIEASAVVNFRILPGESIASVMDNIERIIDDPEISVTVPEGAFASDPSPVSPTESAGFAVLRSVIREVRPDVLVAPRLVVAATDSRHFSDIAENSYRFVGVQLEADEVSGVHGTNERVAAKSYMDAVRMYYRLILRAAEL